MKKKEFKLSTSCKNFVSLNNLPNSNDFLLRYICSTQKNKIRYYFNNFTIVYIRQGFINFFLFYYIKY